MVGLWYAAYGLGLVIVIIGRYPYNAKKTSSVKIFITMS